MRSGFSPQQLLQPTLLSILVLRSHVVCCCTSVRPGADCRVGNLYKGRASLVMSCLQGFWCSGVGRQGY